jgi:hypothetical protein
MKRKLVLGVTSLLGAALLWFIAPAYIKDRVYGLLTFQSNERQCFKFHRSRFNDPDTAYVEGAYVWSKDNETKFPRSPKPNPVFAKYEAVVRVQLRARNSLGAYVPGEIECPLIDGAFNEIEALIHYQEARKRSPQ